jgi:3-isopropylmalate/(R)-2-methylmalate dehydratase small subunit
MGDSVKVDIKTGRIDNLTTGETIQAKPLPDFIMGILEAGGINPYIVKHKSEFKLLK